MSIYNMIFGQNWASDFLMAAVGLHRNDVERLRDVHAGDEGKTIEIYTRTGGGNREDYPQNIMRHLRGWQNSYDDDFDNTYCTDIISVDPEWHNDVAALSDIMSNGVRAEFMQHIAKTLQRNPTDEDAWVAAYNSERKDLESLDHFMANGHTFVPKNDRAMKAALELAEVNDGKLRSAWGILPLEISVKQDFIKSPNARDPDEREAITRIEIDYSMPWKIDLAYWAHCQRRFRDRFPKTMSRIAQEVEKYIER